LCDAGPRGGGSGSGAPSGTYIKPSEPAPETGQSPAATTAPPVSLEDARKITSSEEAQSLVLPPRTIADITAVLDREKPDPAKVAAARAVADKAPPAGLDGAAAARFYFDRGTSAGELGRSAQELADYRKAVELIEPLKSSKIDDYHQFTNGLALTEGARGTYGSRSGCTRNSSRSPKARPVSREPSSGSIISWSPPISGSATWRPPAPGSPSAKRLSRRRHGADAR